MYFFLRCALAVAAFMVYASAFTQSAKPVNTAKLLDDGIALYNKGKYKEAIDVYKKVPRYDSNYAFSLHNISLAYYYDSNFVESKNAAALGLQLFPDRADEWYNLLGNTYDQLGKTEEAIAYYDKIINQFNHAYMPWYNKGITYYNKKNFAEAKKSLQQSLMINPYYAPAHFYLANIYYEEGNMVAAMMAHATSLLVSPTNSYNANSTRWLTQISNVTDDVVKKAAAKKSSNTDDFDMVQEILLSKLALDRKYKLQADLEDPIVRQLQALMEKLSFKDSDKGFAMQYYVPMFERLFKEKQFEPFVNYIFSGLDIKAVNSYVKKNKREVEGIFDLVNDNLTSIRASQKYLVSERKNVALPIIYSNGKAWGKGKIVEQGKKSKLVGLWEFYHDNGAFKSKGVFTDNEERTGEWVYYYKDGKVKEKTMYANDKPNGPSLAWYTNGSPWSIENYKDGELDGDQTEYYFNGQLKKIQHYTAGKKNGPIKEYSSAGMLEGVANYKDDKADGVWTTYHNNGKVETTSTYVNGEIEGKFKKYFTSGILSIEGNLTGGKRNGDWKEFYKNGKLKTHKKYTANEVDGPSKEYYDNGALMVESNYVKDKLEGKFVDYDWDAKVFSESLYEKGRLREIKFFDKDGKEVSNKTTRNGAANLVFYDGFGNKTIEGYFTKDGLRQGKATSYYRDGKVLSVANYNEGYLNGEKVNYYVDGNISSKVNYKAGEEDGYKMEYHESGKLAYEGLVENGVRTGVHIQYDQFGNVSSTSEYTNDVLDGYYEYFEPNGKMSSQFRYRNGWIQGVKQFDTTGKIIYEAEFPLGNGALEYKTLAGKTFTKAAYKNYFLNGPYTTIFSNGNKHTEEYYKLGIQDSISRTYYANGKVDVVGTYSMGERNGEWKYYYENGQLFCTEMYNYGSQNGKVIMYDEDGSLDKEMSYNDGMLDGEYKYFGEDKQLALLLNYHNGSLLSYTYEGKDGKLVPAIPVKNGTGNVVAYYKNGTKSADIYFLEDKEHGVRNVFFTTGKPYIQGTRLYGDENGVKKIYYKTGGVQKEQTYVYGKLHGLSKRFYANGKLLAEETYYNGDLHGACKYYDNTGKLTETKSYYYGSLL
jgi:uncharacterized protein